MMTTERRARVRPASRSRRPHPALGARIVTTGLSVAAMLGIVAVLGLNNKTTTPQPVPIPTTTPNEPTQVADPGIDRTEPAPSSEISNQPIQLTANPALRPAPPAGDAAGESAPAARTNGSR